MNTSTTIGTIGGTLCIVFLQIPWTDLGQSMLLSAVGAATSFLVSFALRALLRKRNR